MTTLFQALNCKDMKQSTYQLAKDWNIYDPESALCILDKPHTKYHI